MSDGYKVVFNIPPDETVTVRVLGAHTVELGVHDILGSHEVIMTEYDLDRLVGYLNTARKDMQYNHGR